MYDLLVLRPGGGWATDSTGPRRLVQERRRDLAASNRGRRQIVRLVDYLGREVP